MNKFLILFIFMLPATTILAQNTAGKIIYEQIFKPDLGDRIKSLEQREGMEALVERLKKPRKFHKTLLFNQKEALFRNYNITEDGAFDTGEAEEENDRIRMMIANSDGKAYHDLEKNEKTEQVNFMEKLFLIKDTAEQYNWKMTTEFDSVGGYICQKAYFEDTSKTVVAWFTPQIPISAGPEGYGQLPGLILKLDIDNGQNIYTASHFEFRELKKDELKVPKKGKEVTREEFREIVKEKMKEMKEMYGGQRNVRIQAH